jgi:uncharacterized protein (TIGR03437 family)
MPHSLKRRRGFLLAAIAMLGAIPCGIVLRSRWLHPGPELTPRNVVNAANFKSGGIAPGEIVVLFPSSAGPPKIAEWPTIFPRSASDLEYMRRQPGWASVGATRVFFDNIAAPVVYSVRGQVETIVPWEVSNRKTTKVALEYEGVRSRPVTLPIVGSAPAIFTLDASGKGQAAMLNETGCCNSARNPATRGTIASLYATGEGNPPLHVKVVVGGVPAEVLYAGNVGELTVNFRVPSNAPVGDAVPLVLVAGSYSSADGVTMAIRSSDREVLIVDREAPIRSRLAEALKGAGYQVFRARDSQEARAQSKDRPLDLVIIDLAMTKEAGLETIDAIRSEHPQVKIIVISAEAGPGVLRSADILGAQMVLRKPLNDGMVVERVRDLLRERPARY